MYIRAMRRLDNIDLRLLRVFVALAEAGSFSSAQIALNLSQSTLSTHIKSLERLLNGALCLRGRRGFRLTPFGESTLRAARDLFADIDKFQQRVGRSSDRFVGRLSIGIVDSIITNPFLALQEPLQRFAAAAPDVYIDLRLGTPHELEQWVAEGARDIAIGPFAKQGPGVAYIPLHQEAHALYCGRQHPLFGQEDVTVADIEATRFSVRAYRQLDDLYRVNHPRASASVIQMEAQAMLILSGQYIGFLPRHIGDGYAGLGMMKVLRPQTYQFFSPHFAAYRRSEKDQPLVKLFVRELRLQAKDKPKIEPPTAKVRNNG
jgi:LysR family transcriptional regulator, transcriptional activator for bauABCD operon